MATSDRAQLNLFGRFRIERNGEPVHLPTRETRLLLAYLALHPEAHGREQLAALLWPDVPDGSARASLRNALSTLRRHLGQDLVEADRETVRLNPDFPVRADALEFRSQATRFLEEPTGDPDAVNLQLYTGDLLGDFYEDWVLTEREFFRELYLKTLLVLTQQMRSKSEYQRAMAFAEQILERDPTNERAHQHLMFCHVALGDRAAALRQFEACRAALRVDLAAEPSSATEQLHEWIQQAPTERLPVEASITNLPIPVSSFIGRQAEMTAVKEELGSARLVTLTGAGGSGKTRLAIQVATDLLDNYTDGVWWVELAAQTDADLLERTVAKALGVPEVPNQPIGDTLAKFLRSRHLLLVLDNCEHLVAACAQLVKGLLGQCPHLSVLATSRERLGIAGERVRPVPTLSTPDPEPALPPAGLLEYEAVQLFVKRATAAAPGFSLTEENAPAVADVCRCLDGLPLAIELAAARANAITPDQMAARLEDVFPVITGSARTGESHHETLHSAIDWSFDLLSREEQGLLCRLSVFAGGWTLPAAEAVCTGDDLAGNEIAGMLARLVDKSLVEAQARGGERRFHLLETIRHYARERLQASGNPAAVRSRHLHYYLDLLEASDSHLDFMLPDGELDQWLARFEAEQENLRAAVRRCLQAEAGATERAALTGAGLRLVSLQHPFLFVRGRFAEGRAWLEQLLEKGADISKATRAQALATLGFLCCWQGDFASARPPLEEALVLYRQMEDGSGIAYATHGLGFATLGEGDAPRARSLFEDALKTARQANDKWIMSFAEHFLAIVLTFQGLYDDARVLFEEGNELIRAMGGHRQALAFSHFHLGRIARLRGDHPAARARHGESMQLFRKRGDRRGIGYSLAGFAALAAAEEDMERSARLSGAMASLEAVLGTFLEAPLQAEYDHALAKAREVLGEEAFAAAVAEGRAMRMEQAIEYAVGTPG